jgi:hypothetical protein
VARDSPCPCFPSVCGVCCPQRSVRQPAPAALVDFFIGYSLRLNTKKNYAAQQRTFVDICRQHGIDPFRPLSEDSLCLVVAVFAATGHKVTTIPGFVASVANFALNNSLGPLPHGSRYDQLMAGIRNFYGPHNVAVPKTAFSMSNLTAFHAHLNLSSFEDARDWCACLLAFFGLLRIGEYADSGLRQRDVRLTPHGVSLTIPYGKTSLVPMPVDISRRDDILCPARAVSGYLAFFRAYPSLPQRPADRFFISRVAAALQPMTAVEFINRVRSLMRVATPGLDPAAYAGHSFHRGGTTALRLAGVPTRPSSVTAAGDRTPTAPTSTRTTTSTLASSPLRPWQPPSPARP